MEPIRSEHFAQNRQPRSFHGPYNSRLEQPWNQPFSWRYDVAGRPGKLRIESLAELKKTFTSQPEAEFGLLIRGERKVEMDIDARVVGELLKMLQKVVGNRGDD